MQNQADPVSEKSPDSQSANQPTNFPKPSPPTPARSLDFDDPDDLVAVVSSSVSVQ
jgi:hypothetical protein